MTDCPCPRRVRSSFPLAASQRRTVPSSEALASCVPSGLKATSRTTPRVSPQQGTIAAVESQDDDLAVRRWRSAIRRPGGVEGGGEKTVASSREDDLGPPASGSQSRSRSSPSSRSRCAGRQGRTRGELVPRGHGATVTEPVAGSQIREGAVLPPVSTCRPSGAKLAPRSRERALPSGARAHHAQHAVLAAADDRVGAGHEAAAGARRHYDPAAPRRGPPRRQRRPRTTPSSPAVSRHGRRSSNRTDVKASCSSVRMLPRRSTARSVPDPDDPIGAAVATRAPSGRKSAPYTMPRMPEDGRRYRPRDPRPARSGRRRR